MLVSPCLLLQDLLAIICCLCDRGYSPVRLLLPYCAALPFPFISGATGLTPSCIVQGHALFTRQAGGDLPCPALDFTGGFNQFMAAAYNLTGQTVEEKFGAPFGETFEPAVSPSLLIQACLRLQPL